MTLRRYAKPKPSRGTVIPADVRARVHARDARVWCVGYGRLPGECLGGIEQDHVRAGGTGMKSVTCDCNLVDLCGGHHRYKTEHGRDARPVLLDYLAQFGYSAHSEGHLTQEKVMAQDPVIASYIVKVVIRSKSDTVTSMPIDALTEIVEGAVTAEYFVEHNADVTVNATAERTDA